MQIFSGVQIMSLDRGAVKLTCFKPEILLNKIIKHITKDGLLSSKYRANGLQANNKDYNSILKPEKMLLYGNYTRIGDDPIVIFRLKEAQSNYKYI